MKVHLGLEKEWEHTFGLPFSDWGNSVIQDGTGFVVGGRVSIDWLTTRAGYLIRKDIASAERDWEIDGYDGEPLWLGPGKEVYSIEKNAAGDYILGTSHGIVKANRSASGPRVLVAYGHHARQRTTLLPVRAATPPRSPRAGRWPCG